jgi:cellulose biosynthesis protein BcsQ
MNNIPVIAFFNNKGGVGKTTLVYHLSWMFADMGRTVLAADLDPQANLTSSFLDDDLLFELWEQESERKTIYGGIEPLVRGIGDINDAPLLSSIDERLHLLPGDLDLSRFEDKLSHEWPLCLDKKESAFRVVSAFWRLMQNNARHVNAGIILVDLGPNLGAINRSILISTDFLVIPLTPDLFSLQGLKNVGPTVRDWREEWNDRRNRNPAQDLELPPGGIKPIGYVAMQHAVRVDRPVKAYEKWMSRIPGVYAEEVLEETSSNEPNSQSLDPNCLGLVKHYRSLIPMSMEARKPMFHLLPADGAIGSHLYAAKEAGDNFKSLAQSIEKKYLYLPSI